MIHTPLSRVKTLVTRLRGCTRGVALTEFGMAVPVLLTLGLFGLETANLAMAHLRVSNIAMLTADNASRVRTSIDEADVIELFIGAKMTGAGIGFAQNGRIVLSSIERNAAGNGQWIRWQRCDGARVFSSAYGVQDRGQSDATLQYVGTAATPISAAAGTAVNLAEVSYVYQPIIPNSFLTGIEIRY
ncbi:MAG: TadE/TadG family type IV pilus assembly protein [Sphingosinicella sp.]